MRAPAATSKVPADELVVAMASLPPILDPYQYVAAPNIIPYYALYDAPTFIDVLDGAKVKPNLAKGWKNVSDTVWEFEMEEGIKFPNGEDVDAEAVKFALDYLLDPENKLPVTSRVSTIKEVNVTGKYTFTVETKEVDPLLPARMAVVFLLPPKAFSESDPAQFFQQPIGTGPYRVAEFVKDDKLVLEVNPDYRGDEPVIKRVTMQVMPDASARIAALRAGDVDLVHQLPTDQAASIEAAGYRVNAAIEGTTMVLDLYRETGPLSDKRVRHAINYAIDKEALVAEIMSGHGLVSEGQLVFRGLPGFSEDLKAYPYDPDKARQLLEEAGAVGLELDFEISNGWIVNDKKLGEAITAMLEDVGLKINLTVNEYSVYLQNFYKPREERADLFAWRAGLTPFLDPDAPMAYFATGGITSHPLNWQNDEYDEYYWESRRTVDPAKRAELIQKALAVFREEAPVAFIMHTPDVWGVNPAVQDLQIGANGVVYFHQLKKAQ